MGDCVATELKFVDLFLSISPAAGRRTLAPRLRCAVLAFPPHGSLLRFLDRPFSVAGAIANNVCDA